MEQAVTPTFSVQAAVRAAAADYGAQPAVGLHRRMQSFAQTYERSLRLASALEGLGLGPGDRVAIAATNGPWFFETYFAMCETGMVEVPINLRFTLDELQRYLVAVSPQALIVTADQVPLGRDLQAIVPSLRYVIGIGDEHGLSLDYDSLLARASPFERALRPVDEPVLISATSGTSGDAKAVVHTQKTTASAYAPLIERFDVDRDAHFVTGLAMYFATAYSGWTMSFIAGAQQTIMPAYNPADWVSLVESVRGTHGFLGPTPVYLIMDGGIDLRRLRGLRYLSLGGAAADPTRLLVLTEVLGERVAIQFGMTELGAGTSLLGREFLDSENQLLPRHRSIGRPVTGLDARLVDAAGSPLSERADESGELELRGPMVTPGYVSGEGGPDLNGWFRTGDVATIDQDGFIFILDRKKDLIVSGGINIAPLEIEQVLGAHPAVEAVGVCAVPDSTYGEAVHASIVVRAGHALTEADVQAWCRDQLASVKKPRSIAFVDALPISSTGKLLRRELRRSLMGQPSR